jgi:hypothetical protein
MQKRLMTILLSLVVSLTACSRRQSTVTARREVSAAEYEVLSTWSADTFTGQKAQQIAKGVVKIVISDTTQSGDDDLLRDENGRPIPWEKTAESLRKNAPTLQQATIDSFRGVNAQQAMLRRSFQPVIDYELADSTKIDSIFTKKGDPWSAYYKQFPGSQGILTFSRVGFSADGRQALFYVSNRCGGLCGGGSYVVMENINGRWMIGKEIVKWVS